MYEADAYNNKSCSHICVLYAAKFYHNVQTVGIVFAYYSGINRVDIIFITVHYCRSDPNSSELLVPNMYKQSVQLYRHETTWVVLYGVQWKLPNKICQQNLVGLKPITTFKPYMIMLSM